MRVGGEWLQEALGAASKVFGAPPLGPVSRQQGPPDRG